MGAINSQSDHGSVAFDYAPHWEHSFLLLVLQMIIGRRGILVKMQTFTNGL